MLCNDIMNLNEYIEKLEKVLVKNDLIPCRNLIIIIPMYNEGKNIEEFFNRLFALNFPINKIIVINDGSNDNTLKLIPNHPNIIIINNIINLGSVVSLMKGFREALKYINPNTIIVRMDGDLEHQPEDISNLIKDVNRESPFALGVIPYDKRSGFITNFINKDVGVLSYDKYTNTKVEQFCSGFYAIHNSIFEELVNKIEDERLRIIGDMLFIDFLMYYNATSNRQFSIVQLLPIEDKHIKKVGVFKLVNYFKTHLELVAFMERSKDKNLLRSEDL